MKNKHTTQNSRIFADVINHFLQFIPILIGMATVRLFLLSQEISCWDSWGKELTVLILAALIATFAAWGAKQLWGRRKKATVPVSLGLPFVPKLVIDSVGQQNGIDRPGVRLINASRHVMIYDVWLIDEQGNRFDLFDKLAKPIELQVGRSSHFRSFKIPEYKPGEAATLFLVIDGKTDTPISIPVVFPPMPKK